MLRSIGLALILFKLGACAASVPPHAQDHDAVIAAVLQAQPDMAAQRREYLREYPEEERWLSNLFDYRLCVESRTAGSPSDFASSTITPYSPDDPPPKASWDRSRRSFPISREGLPRFLRRASLFSICPSGVLRISNPQFEGGTARVLVEHRCRGWCGSGGEFILTKVEGRWVVEEYVNRWQA
jgi:hypothetical protein